MIVTGLGVVVLLDDIGISIGSIYKILDLFLSLLSLPTTMITIGLSKVVYSVYMAYIEVILYSNLRLLNIDSFKPRSSLFMDYKLSFSWRQLNIK